jgi:hypothetical protein
MTINGGADVPAGGGEVSVWCDSQEGIVEEASAQIMAIRVAGFF